MSILQDLDPKYAKMQAQPKPHGWRPIGWLALLLLVIFCGSWLLLSRQSNKPGEVGGTERMTANQPETNTEQPKKATLTNSLPPPSTARAIPEPASTEKTAKSALIREVPTQEVRNSDNSTKNRSTSSNTTNNTNQQIDLAHSDSRNESAASPHKETHRKIAASAKPKEAHRRTTQALTPADNKPMTQKKAAERDIEIISAIVR